MGGAHSGSPTGGLRTPCHSVIKHPLALTHTFFSTPLEEVPGSWADGPAGVQQQQQQLEEGGMLIEVVRGCVFPPGSPAATSTLANTLSAVTPRVHTHKDTHICLTLKVSLHSREDGC